MVVIQFHRIFARKLLLKIQSENEKFSLTEKNFVKSTILVKPLLSRNFLRKKCERDVMSAIHSVVISQNFPHAILFENFREINVLNDCSLKRTSENRELLRFAQPCATLTL